MSADAVIHALKGLRDAVHENAKSKGFHRNIAVADLVDDFLETDNEPSRYNLQVLAEKARATKGSDLGTKVALIHSELSELLEAVRNRDEQGHRVASEKIKGFSLEEEELADVVIRCLDVAAAENYRLEEAILAKMEYNKGRPHRHGKQF